MAPSITRAAILALALTAAAGAGAQNAPSSPPPDSPPAPVEAAPAPPATGAARTLAPNAADPSSPDEVTLAARPAVIVAGSSAWGEGFTTLKGAFDRLNEEMTKAGLKPAGRPLAVFTQTDDAGFRYEAMIPVEEGTAPNLGPDIRLGRTPEGRAVRFVHKGPYEDVDTTYETVTAYLDVKGIVVKDTFIEEYLADLTNAADPVDINIYALPR